MPFVLAVIGVFVVALLVALAVNCLGLYSVRKMENAHWTERARKLFPIRRSAGMNVWLISGLGFAAACVFFPSDSDSWTFSMIVATWIGAFLGTFPLVKKLFPEFSFFGWLKYSFSTWALRLGSVTITLIVATLMPEELGWRTIVLAGVVLSFQIALQYGLWLWIGSKFGAFEPAKDSEKIAEIVRQTSGRMQIPYRSVWKWRTPVGYAAVFPLGRDLIFSEGLLRTHPDEEVAAICAHELAHLTETRGTHRARLLASLTFFPFIFLRPAINLIGPLGAALVWLPIPLAGIFIRKLGRKMEVRADSVASKNQESEGVYARALERLYRNNQMPAVMPGKRQVHPHLYDRLLAAGVTPDYPRPKAPASISWTSGLMILVLVLFLTVVFLTQQIFQTHGRRFTAVEETRLQSAKYERKQDADPTPRDFLYARCRVWHLPESWRG